jgi:hypothetical protein
MPVELRNGFPPWNWQKSLSEQGVCFAWGKCCGLNKDRKNADHPDESGSAIKKYRELSWLAERYRFFECANRLRKTSANRLTEKSLREGILSDPSRKRIMNSATTIPLRAEAIITDMVGLFVCRINVNRAAELHYIEFYSVNDNFES